MAREALIAEAAKHGVDDLSEKELATMTDAVTMSAREAASGAVSKGKSGAKTLWTALQTIEAGVDRTARQRRGAQPAQRPAARSTSRS